MSNTIKLFKDLQFDKHPIGGVKAKMGFSNGYTISVVAGNGLYSTPRKSLSDPNEFSEFEVAIFNKDGEFATTEFFPNHNDDVLGWQSRADINTLMLGLNGHGV